MKLNSYTVLDTLKENGGILKSYGESSNSSLFKKLKLAMLISTVALSISTSASVLPNQQQNETGKSIPIVETVIQEDQVMNTLLNNYIIISNLKNGNYENIDLSYTDEEPKITKNNDKRSILEILNSVQKENKHNLEKNIFIPSLGVTLSKDDDEETLKIKLKNSANYEHNDSDVKVRSQTMIFIIANEGLSSKKGKDAQNHLTVGYGYDVDEQIKARVSAGMQSTQAKKIVYSEMAKVGVDVKQLVASYNNKNHRIEITPTQSAILSANILDSYISFAKKSAGPNLWGIYKDGEIKPSDFNRTDWSQSDFEKKGGYYNSYLNLNDRMKSAYVYSVYNAGPRALGNSFKNQLEKGNVYSAIHSIRITWKDKDNNVIQNQRLANNLALAFSSNFTMETFVSNESDKYIKTEISQALSGESPNISKMLKLEEAYNKNINLLFSLDVKKIKKGVLNEVDQKKYATIKKQSDGLLKNINNYKNEFGDEVISPYDPNKHIQKFEDVKNDKERSNEYLSQLNNYNADVISKENELRVNNKELKENKITDQSQLEILKNKNKDFKLSEDFKPNTNSYIEKMKNMAVETQEMEIQKLKIEEIKRRNAEKKNKIK